MLNPSRDKNVGLGGGGEGLLCDPGSALKEKVRFGKKAKKIPGMEK